MAETTVQSLEDLGALKPAAPEAPEAEKAESEAGGDEPGEKSAGTVDAAKA